jgi:formylglycine-generating enzyme required for sulfatase activity
MSRAALLSRFLLVALSSLLGGVVLLGPGEVAAGKSKKDPWLVAKAPASLHAGAFPTITNSIGMKLVRIPKGTFTMGSPAGEVRHQGDEQQHKVEITKDFYLGMHEVTQAQYRKVTGSNPSHFCANGGGKSQVKGMDTGDFPVENVSYEDAVAFCKKLSDLPAEKKANRTYRLPSEAQWEQACRGGAPSSQPFPFGGSLSSRHANFNGHDPFGGAGKNVWLGRTCKVGNYKPNKFGLFDMQGNVWEWCADWYAEDYYGKSPPRDPLGPAQGVDRVIRGGSWISPGRNCRSANRFRVRPELRNHDVGFRVALVPAGR